MPDFARRTSRLQRPGPLARPLHVEPLQLLRADHPGSTPARRWAVRQGRRRRLIDLVRAASASELRPGSRAGSRRGREPPGARRSSSCAALSSRDDLVEPSAARRSPGRSASGSPRRRQTSPSPPGGDPGRVPPTSRRSRSSQPAACADCWPALPRVEPDPEHAPRRLLRQAAIERTTRGRHDRATRRGLSSSPIRWAATAQRSRIAQHPAVASLVGRGKPRVVADPVVRRCGRRGS